MNIYIYIYINTYIYIYIHTYIYKSYHIYIYVCYQFFTYSHTIYMPIVKLFSILSCARERNPRSYFMISSSHSIYADEISVCVVMSWLWTIMSKCLILLIDACTSRTVPATWTRQHKSSDTLGKLGYRNERSLTTMVILFIEKFWLFNHLQDIWYLTKLHSHALWLWMVHHDYYATYTDFSHAASIANS